MKHWVLFRKYRFIDFELLLRILENLILHVMCNEKYTDYEILFMIKVLFQFLIQCQVYWNLKLAAAEIFK